MHGLRCKRSVIVTFSATATVALRDMQCSITCSAAEAGVLVLYTSVSRCTVTVEFDNLRYYG